MWTASSLGCIMISLAGGNLCKYQLFLLLFHLSVFLNLPLHNINKHSMLKEWAYAANNKGEKISANHIGEFSQAFPLGSEALTFPFSALWGGGWSRTVQAMPGSWRPNSFPSFPRSFLVLGNNFWEVLCFLPSFYFFFSNENYYVYLSGDERLSWLINI